MNNKLNTDKENFDKILSILTDGVDRAIGENKVIDIEYKSKLLAVSAFLNFVKEGARIKLDVSDDGKPIFIVNM